ncbi:hypothetical protein FA10DRAFT_31078 [Acaromyces ingoldii]|uniref:Uncharacterized protein n=1 Tax=Acaromyces ingoldii TaxID=215250 RepID=A0A316YWH3_9BASI|nr:hypothetical protein FA10DRAFT_31078 [Acaromyces ingoldii]PWN93767.1 hypothetical protein FA10DRAFT_31078 [Acaromyces ingoldii]
MALMRKVGKRGPCSAPPGPSQTPCLTASFRRLGQGKPLGSSTSSTSSSSIGLPVRSELDRIQPKIDLHLVSILPPFRPLPIISLPIVSFICGLSSNELKISIGRSMPGCASLDLERGGPSRQTTTAAPPSL